MVVPSWFYQGQCVLVVRVRPLLSQCHQNGSMILVGVLSHYAPICLCCDACCLRVGHVGYCILPLLCYVLRLV